MSIPGISKTSFQGTSIRTLWNQSLISAICPLIIVLTLYGFVSINVSTFMDKPGGSSPKLHPIKICKPLILGLGDILLIYFFLNVGGILGLDPRFALALMS